MFSPGLLNFALRPLTLVVSDVAQGAVDGGEVWFTDIEEVRPHSSHRHFGDVGEGLADGAAEDEHAHLLVESRDVGVSHKRLGPLVQKIDPVALPDDDLEGRKRRKCQWGSGGHVSINSAASRDILYGIGRHFENLPENNI